MIRRDLFPMDSKVPLMEFSRAFCRLVAVGASKQYPHSHHQVFVFGVCGAKSVGLEAGGG